LFIKTVSIMRGSWFSLC